MKILLTLSIYVIVVFLVAQLCHDAYGHVAAIGHDVAHFVKSVLA